MTPALRTPLALRPSEVVPGWRWRTHDGQHLDPVTMRTTHLFYTLRMVWNHRMPAHMRVGRNVRRWQLNQSPTYLREAIVQIGAELFRRTDIPAWMVRELHQMSRWLADTPAQRFITDARLPLP